MSKHADTTAQISAPAGGPRMLRMSYEEYRAWADEDVHAEWVDGEVIVSMSERSGPTAGPALRRARAPRPRRPRAADRSRGASARAEEPRVTPSPGWMGRLIRGRARIDTARQPSQTPVAWQWPWPFRWQRAD